MLSSCDAIQDWTRVHEFSTHACVTASLAAAFGPADGGAG